MTEKPNKRSELNINPRLFLQMLRLPDGLPELTRSAIRTALDAPLCRFETVDGGNPFHAAENSVSGSVACRIFLPTGEVRDVQLQAVFPVERRRKGDEKRIDFPFFTLSGSSDDESEELEELGLKHGLAASSGKSGKGKRAKKFKVIGTDPSERVIDGEIHDPNDPSKIRHLLGNGGNQLEAEPDSSSLADGKAYVRVVREGSESTGDAKLEGGGDEHSPPYLWSEHKWTGFVEGKTNFLKSIIAGRELRSRYSDVDVLQETFCEMWENITRFPDEHELACWLVQKIRGKSVDLFRYHTAQARDARRTEGEHEDRLLSESGDRSLQILDDSAEELANRDLAKFNRKQVELLLSRMNPIEQTIAIMRSHGIRYAVIVEHLNREAYLKDPNLKLPPWNKNRAEKIFSRAKKRLSEEFGDRLEFFGGLS